MKEFRATTARGEVTIRLDDIAEAELNRSLQILKIPLARRKAIMEGRVPIPGTLYPSVKKKMQRRHPGVEIIERPEEEQPLVPGTEGPRRMLPARKVTSRQQRPGRAGATKALTLEEQVKLERLKKERAAKSGDRYVNFIPQTPSPAVGSRRAEPTGNILVKGSHRGTKYYVEEIAPDMWQPRVYKHPWTKLRATAAERSAAKRWLVGDLIKQEFPVFQGTRGWAEAEKHVEEAIDDAYALFVETGNIPPELERHVRKEKAKVRKRGKTPSLAPRVRKKGGRSGNPRRNGALDEWWESRMSARGKEEIVKAEIRSKAAVKRHEAAEARRAEKEEERKEKRARRKAEQDRLRAAQEEYRAGRIEEDPLYGDPQVAMGSALGKITAGAVRAGRAGTKRFRRIFTKAEGKKAEKAATGPGRRVYADLGTKEIHKFEKSFKAWEKSTKAGKPDFKHLLDAYDRLLYAHAFLTLAGKDDRTIVAVREVRDSLLNFLKCADPKQVGLITQTIMKGARKLSQVRGNPKNPKNPGVEVHQEMGEGYLAESEKLWESYCSTKSATALLNAYRVLELACQEFEFSGDKKGMKQAKAGIKAARSEILGGMKKKRTKKKAKKATKKRAKKRTKR